jgi:membrane-bound ClpP family serine protease
VAITTLRPSGRIAFAGKLLDACTSGEFVEAGTVVRVIGVRVGMIEVEPTIPSSAGAGKDAPAEGRKDL